MNTNALIENLMDILKEAEIKIGYSEQPLSLYYPLDSLNHLLETNLAAEEMLHTLQDAFSSDNQPLGAVTVSVDDTRFCFRIPESGVSHVHHTRQNPFLEEFISLIRSTSCTIDDILAVFHRYSDRVTVEKIEGNEEFEYLIYFTDGIPDRFWYCIQLEHGHAVYHRFTEWDYRAFGF